jgi:hypothetical protein
VTSSPAVVGFVNRRPGELSTPISKLAAQMRNPLCPRLPGAELRQLPGKRCRSAAYAPEYREFQWKPKCTHGLRWMLGEMEMWVVWCLAALIGVCLLLSTVDLPHSRR